MLPRRWPDLQRPENESGAENEEEQMETEAHSGTPQPSRSRPLASAENSPVSSLSGSLSQLSTNSQRRTPKHALDLSDADAAASGPSSEGVFLDSPTPIYSPSCELLDRNQRRKIRRIKSTPDFKVYGYSPKANKEAEDSGERDGPVAPTSGVSGAGGSRSVIGLSDQPIMEEGSEDSDVAEKMQQDPGSKDPPPSDSQGDVGEKDSTEKDPLPRKLSKGFKRSLTFEPMQQDPGSKDPSPSDSQGDVGEMDSTEKDPLPDKPSTGLKRSLSFDLEGEEDNTGCKIPVGLKGSVTMVKDEHDIVGDLMASSESDEEVPKKRRKSAPGGKMKQKSLVAKPSSSIDTPPATVPSAATAKSMKTYDETPVRQYRLAKRRAQLEAMGQSPDPPVRANIFSSPSRTMSPGTLRRSLSLSEATIKDAVHRMSEEPNLIADSSKLCLLPTISGKHQDLKAISHETMADVLNGKYAEQLEDYTIVDCRYPYEYDGGHIKGAVNIYTKDMLIDQFLKNPVEVQDPDKRYIMIFHCEFSSERAPSLYRQLRTLDRTANTAHYPKLFYPEVYLLEGGYSAFFVFKLVMCEPQNYIPMLHKDYTGALAEYQADRKKSKKTKRTSTLDRSSAGGGSSRSLRL